MYRRRIAPFAFSFLLLLGLPHASQTDTDQVHPRSSKLSERDAPKKGNIESSSRADKSRASKESEISASGFFTGQDLYRFPGAKTDLSYRNASNSAMLDTVVLGAWNFDSVHGCTQDGWTSLDNTEAPGSDSAWHVSEDSSATCFPSKVMWCGLEPSGEFPLVCWADLPGYGNGWQKYLYSKRFSFTGSIEWSFRIAWDTETDFDFVRFQYDSLGTWADRLVVDGKSGAGGDCRESLNLSITPFGQTRTKLRFCFESDGAFSDEDGFDVSEWGAVSVDSILVTDDLGVVIPLEDWEDEAIGSLIGFEEGDTTWFAPPESQGVGDFVGVDAALFEEDPCRDNTSCQLYFYSGSEETDPAYPGQAVLPNGIENWAISPAVPWNPGGSIPAENREALLEFDMYLDLPLSQGVFFAVWVRPFSASSDPCNSEWERIGSGSNYGDPKAFTRQRWSLTGYIPDPPPDSLQVAIDVHDWCEGFPVLPCLPRTPSPSIDNVRIFRLNRVGPVWNNAFTGVESLFQDNFSEDGTVTGTVRMDMARNIGTGTGTSVHPGDSSVVQCTAPADGGLTNPPALYVRVISGPHAGLTGAGLEGNYGTFESVVGGWTCIRADSARRFGNIKDDHWAIDLNDSLFVPADILQYFFFAQTNGGNSGTFPEDTANGNFFEVSCLPDTSHDILYVDDFDGFGAEPYYLSALDQAGYGDRFDKYDVLRSWSEYGNGLGSRVKNIGQLRPYRKILWSSGFLERYTIADVDPTDETSDDASLLRDYLKLSDHDVGLFVSGDNIAFDIDSGWEPAGLELLNDWCGVRFVSKSQLDLSGVASPLLEAESASPWAGAVTCSTHVAHGGCADVGRIPSYPFIRRLEFDVLDTLATSQFAFTWPGHDPGAGDPRGAVITNERTNDLGFTVRTVWQGYSFHNIRDDGPSVPIDRTCFLAGVLTWLGNTPGTPTGSTVIPLAYELEQNVPNPFNPATRIRFALPLAGHVKLTVYDLQGRLIRKLFDGHREAGIFVTDWNGENDDGNSVASGVYFYRLQATGFTDQKKMVLLR